MYTMVAKFIHKALLGILGIGLTLSTIGAGLPLAGRLSPSMGVLEAAFVAPGACLTQLVRLTLASEQVGFCAPASLPFTVVEDSTSDPSANYAGLAQMADYGVVNIKATIPGNSPGIGKLVYTSGGVVAYRQAVWNMESAKTDRRVSNGSSGVFWGETVPGIQVDLPLSNSTGKIQIRSIEWFVVHNSRLWSFTMAWDTEMQNAGEWEAASRKMMVQTPQGVNPADTAIDLGAAFLESQASSGISTLGAPGVSSTEVPPPHDVGLPSWWGGKKCDDTNYYNNTTPQTHSVLLAKWHNVYACGPVGGPYYFVHFFSGAQGENEFESVELVMRFLYLEWSIVPFQGNGNTIKDYLPSSMVFYPNDGSHGIVPGDILTEDASAQVTNGHAAIVTGVSLDGSGTGTVSILEQNVSSAGQRSLNVKNWQVQPDELTLSTIQGWLHVKGNQDDGNLDPAFTPGSGANGRVKAIAIKSNGRILIAGNFTSYNGTSVNRIARLNADGTLDTGYAPAGPKMTNDTPHISALAIYPSTSDYAGSILIGGFFDSYNGVSKKYIARVNGDGSLDASFAPSSIINADIYKIVILADDTALIGGSGILFRLRSGGSVDTTFPGKTNGNVNDIAVQPDGKIILGGSFSTVDGTARAGIARLNSDGTLDTNFDPGTGIGTVTATNVVNSLSLSTDGKILIGGTFTSYNGTPRNGVARLNSNATLDTTFDPGTGISTSGSVTTILAQTDGRILIGGNFSSYNGTTLNYFGRLNYNGSLDTTFSANLDNQVKKAVLQDDGKIVVGGDFTKDVARLLNSILSCYTLTTLVTPAAGGSITANTAPNCPGGKYLSGTPVQLTVNLNPDYSLVAWSGDASGSANPLTVTMDGDKSITANLMASPGNFNKLEPGDGALNVPADPTLSWAASDGAASYEYCLSTTNSTCDSDGWISTGLQTSVPLSNLLPSVTYYWQVRARNQVATTDATGGWWSFTRDGIPAVPVTVSPGGTIINRQPAYIWNASNGATSYHVTVYSFGALNNVIDDDVPASVCSSGVCTYQPAVDLPLGSYEFKVAATATGTSDFSPWRTFTEGLGLFLPWIASSGN